MQSSYSDDIIVFLQYMTKMTNSLILCLLIYSACKRKDKQITKLCRVSRQSCSYWTDSKYENQRMHHNSLQISLWWSSWTQNVVTQTSQLWTYLRLGLFPGLTVKFFETYNIMHKNELWEGLGMRLTQDYNFMYTRTWRLGSACTLSSSRVILIT